MTASADRIELVDEDDRWRRLLGLREQIPDTRGANADDRLDELRCRDREERGVRLACDGASEQRLARPRGAREQDPVGHAPAKTSVTGRVAQEVDDLGQLRLRLVDARDVVERDPDRGWIDPSCLRAAEAAEPPHASAVLGGAAHEQDDHADDQQRRTEAQQERHGERRALGGRLGVDLDAVGLQQRGQLIVVPERRDLGFE
jgi:hypothetical protein